MTKTKIWFVIAPGKSMSQSDSIEGFPVASFYTIKEAQKFLLGVPGCWIEEGYQG